MPSIPDTGGGASGFAAFLLWHVYRHFPFSGSVDWVFLFLLLSVAVHFVHAPVFLKLHDMLQRQPLKRLARSRWFWMYFAGFELWMGLLVWFFSSPAGATFLEGRNGQPKEACGVVLHIVLVYLGPVIWMAAFAGLFGIAWLVQRLLTRDDDDSLPLTLDDWSQNPVLIPVKRRAGAKHFRNLGVLISSDFLVGVISFEVAMTFYWHWSAASVLMMFLFSLTRPFVNAVAFPVANYLERLDRAGVQRSASP
jgi:hypothetical protein